MPIPTAEERLGTKLADKYRLDRILGKGGFGVVYAGVHEWTGRAVAAKILNYDIAQQGPFVQRFLQEARAAAKLGHENVVDVLDMGQDPDGTVYLVLELLNGESLGERLQRQGSLSPSEALSNLVPVMDALADAHDHGIVHRDLKPDNIFLSIDGKGRVVPKLLDFGIAKMADGGRHTHSGLVIGTPHYMSPEQARGLSDVGPQADVWSMGVVWWQCLTGSVPFDAPTSTGVLAEILTQRARPFAAFVPTISAGLAAVIDRSLLHEREARYPHMRAFMEAVMREAAPYRRDEPTVPVLAAPSSQHTPAPTMPLGGATPDPMHVVPPPRGSSFGRLLVVLGVVFAGLFALAVVAAVGGVALWSSDRRISQTEEIEDPPPPLDPPTPEPAMPPVPPPATTTPSVPVALPADDPAPLPTTRPPDDDEVRACSTRGDNECIIRLLEGRARTQWQLGTLIEAYRARGDTSSGIRHMREFVARYPNTPRARAYQTILARQGGG